MDFLQMSISSLLQAQHEKRISARELTELYLARIAQHNQAGANINAIREVNPRALEDAAALDAERARGTLRGPLHGIPVALKDNICTADGMRTTVGAVAFADFLPPRDAFIVKQLREAGAIILGKANLTEFTDVMSDRMASDFSALGGRVRNPYGFEYGRGGGSSVGPAAAVAAGFCAAAIGSETINSIQDPACTTSLVGLKPTVPLVSRAGIVPNCLSQDVAGPLTRCVADAALLLGVIAGVDFDDTLTLTAAGRASDDYVSGLRRDGLVGARVGIARDVYFDGLDEDELRITEQCLDAMRDFGCVILDPVDIPTAKEVAAIRSSVLRNEFKDGIDAWLHALGERAPVGSLQALIEFNRQDPEVRMPCGQALFEVAVNMPGVASPTYQADRFKDIVLSRTAGIDAAMDSYRLDALLVPQARAAKMLGKAGYPAVAVPAGYKKDGTAVGLTFFGKAYSEATLLNLAYSFEALTQARKPPRLD